MDPFFAGIFHDERAQREGEGHGEPDVAEIKHGRVNHHLGILQQRIQAVTVGGNCSLHDGERVRREVQQRQEEDLHARQNHRRVSEEARVGLVAQPQHESISGEQQRPEQQRTFLAGPQHGELIRTGQIAIAVVEDVGDGEIVVEGANDQEDRSEKDGRERGNARAASGFAQTLRTPAEQRHQPMVRRSGDASASGAVGG